MNDDERLRRLAAHAGPAEGDPGFDDRLNSLLQGGTSRGRLSTRAVLLLAAALLLAVGVGSVIVVGSGISKLPVLLANAAPRLVYELGDDIYLADSDGSNAVRVAGGPDAVVGDPQCQSFGGEGSIWAPDGRHLAFRSGGSDGCPRQVHVLDAEGRAVATVPGDGWDVKWAPDSTRFATWVEIFGTIAIYSIEGERRALLTVPPSCDQASDQDPVWSPDGKSLIVWSCEVPIDGSAPGRFYDDRAALNTSCVRVVSSPDGTRVASVEWEGDGETLESSLVITESDGTMLQVVDDEPGMRLGCGLAWSPTSDRVAYIQWSHELIDGSSAESNIRLVDIPTGQVVTLAAAPEIWIHGFSPDGDRILFATRDQQGDPEESKGLWSVNADGSHQQLLVPGSIWGEWQPLMDRN